MNKWNNSLPKLKITTFIVYGARPWGNIGHILGFTHWRILGRIFKYNMVLCHDSTYKSGTADFSLVGCKSKIVCPVQATGFIDWISTKLILI